MSLLLELQADLQDQFPNEDRRLYVWCCRKKQCSRKPGSVRAFRETKKAKHSRNTEKPAVQTTSKSDAPKQDLGSQIFGIGLNTTSSLDNNPFSMSKTTAQQLPNPFSKDLSSLAAKPPQTPNTKPEPLTQDFAEKLRISSTSEPSVQSTDLWPEESSFPKPFPHFYLAPEPEFLERLTSLPSELSNNAVVSTSDELDRNSKDIFESTMDKTFQQFSDTIAQNSEQVLRYEFKGHPLLYSATDEVGKIFSSRQAKLPLCTNCNKPRTFELQLTPHAIIELEGEDLSLDGMEWGSIIVGVCTADCQAKDIQAEDVGYLEEWTGVQWEETKKKS